MIREEVTIDPSEISKGELHSYLLASVAPRPIAFASTVNKEGVVNLSPFSFFNAFSANPPIVVFSPSRRGRNNTTKDTYNNVKEVPEVVINVVNYAIVEQMSLTSTEYDEGVDEFVKSGLTPMASKLVSPPRVLESPVSLECKVNQVIELGDEGAAGNLVIAEVLLIHVKKEYLKRDQSIDSTKLDLVGRMGESWYTRVTKDSLFEIPKPIRTKGIGVDSLPRSIKNSNILSPNNLGRLGNVENLPSESEVKEAMQRQDVREIFLEFENQRDEIKDALHHLGKEKLEKGKTKTALTLLMVVDQV